jgi:hypothetical protein
MIHLIAWGNPCRLYIHLAFAYTRWSLKRRVKRTWTVPPFPPMRVLEVSWSRALSLVCEVALNLTGKEPLSGMGPFPCNPRSRAMAMADSWFFAASFSVADVILSLNCARFSSAIRLMLLVSNSHFAVCSWISLSICSQSFLGWWRILPSTNCHNICNLQPERF